MRNSDWSSDVCSSDLLAGTAPRRCVTGDAVESSEENPRADQQHRPKGECHLGRQDPGRHPHGDTQETEAKDILDGDRKSVVEGKSVSVRVDRGGSRTMKTNITEKTATNTTSNK